MQEVHLHSIQVGSAKSRFPGEKRGLSKRQILPRRAEKVKIKLEFRVFG